MTESRHARIEALFNACLALPPKGRDAWLAESCAGDAELRAEVADLLARDASTGDASLGPVVRFAPEPLPETIGPYRLGERLGEGGFGEVYAAEQERPVRRRVAIKVLKPGMDSRAVLARFAAERHALARMDHPAIARVFDAGSTPGGRPFFVMERVDGEAITAFCDRHRLATRSRIELMIAVCRAVAHAHQKGIIHRDLKPSNLLVTMVDGMPAPKVIDFGIAKAIEEAPDPEAPHTRQGEFLGTPEYASPEQAESGGADVDTRTDVYALGAVLYRLLAGRPPFDSRRLRGAGWIGMARILREEDPPRPSVAAAAGTGGGSTDGGRATAARPRELRGDLDWIALKALDRDRARRYPSAAALADDLVRHLKDEAVLASPPGGAYRIGKFVRRHRAAILGAAAVSLTLVVGILATTGQAIRARRAEGAARREAQVATAVRDFLTRMLGSADPERNPRGGDLTVREMVDGAARELDAAPAATADVESGMRQTLGSTYMGLGLYEPAERQLLRAAELRERAGGDGTEAIESRLSLAELDVRRGAYPTAESLLASLAERVRAPRLPAALRVRYLRLRGDNLTNLGRNEDADSLLVSAVAAARGAAAPDSLTIAGALSDLARLRSRRGRMDEADSLARESLGIVARGRRGDHHDVATQMGGLAEILRQEGRYAEADSLYARVVDMERRVLGPRHPGVAYALANRAVVLNELGRFDESERCHREALALLTVALGADHPEVVVVMGNLATALQDRGVFEESLALRRRVLEATRRLRGPGHPDVYSALNNLGSLYRLMRRYPDAESAFREAIAGFRTAFAGEHPLVAVATHNLGKTQLDAGRATAAEATLREALRLGAGVFPPDHVNLAIFSANHARALMGLGRWSDAEAELLPARERIAATFGPRHPRTREAAADLANLYARSGRPVEAARWRLAAADTLVSAATAATPGGSR